MQRLHRTAAADGSGNSGGTKVVENEGSAPTPPLPLPDHLAAKFLLRTLLYEGGTIAVLLLAAGTSAYWQAWLFTSIHTAWALFNMLYFLKHNKAFLASRLFVGPGLETRPLQQLIVVSYYLVWLASYVVYGLDRRYGWSSVPLAVMRCGLALITLSCVGMFWVFHTNSFARATISVTSDQKVISSGPYSIVRHPMYTAGMLQHLSAPLALGTWWGLLPCSLGLPLTAWRLLDEERMLAAGLAGYNDYRRKVPWRLVPFVW